MPANAPARAGFDPYAALTQQHRVTACLHAFAVMRETPTVATVRLGRIVRIQLHLAGNPHHQHITQVGMAGAREMRVPETHDDGIARLVAGSLLAGMLEVGHRGLRRPLDHAERRRGTGEGVAV